MNIETSNTIFTVKDEKITLQEAAILYFMFQKENTIGRSLNFKLSDLSLYFDNISSNDEWALARDILVLTGAVDFSQDDKFYLTEYGSSFIVENFNQIDALSAIYEGAYINKVEECEGIEWAT